MDTIIKENALWFYLSMFHFVYIKYFIKIIQKIEFELLETY